MTRARRIILAGLAALSLLSSIAASFAQAPAPVPALPDSERRTSYSIAATQCSCAVNFQLFGDSNDFQNWVEVFLNGVRVNYNDPNYGWTITSPSGPLTNLARPISNAVLTFATAQTGTVQIVGARRPRRVAQFAENTGVPARNLNQALTDIIAMQRENWDKTNDVTGRAVLARPGETLALLPVLANRQNMGACFDSGGNLTSCVSVPSTTIAAGSGISFTGTNPTTIATTPGVVPQLAGTNIWTGQNSYTATSTFTGDALFGSGRPWCDVRAQGALGNGVADDTAAIQGCVTALQATYGSTGGIVYFPPSAGPYCTFTGISDGAGTVPIDFMGAGMQVLETCGHNVTTLTIAHQQSMVENLTIYGYGIGTDTFGAATLPALSATTGASYAIFRHLYVGFGTFPIEAQCSGCRFEDITVQYAYGDSSGTRAANALVLNSGQYWSHVSFDQVLPVSPAPAFPTTISAWTTNHAYTKGTVVTITCAGRSWYIQAANAGISKTTGTGPTCLNYGSYATDAVTGSCPSPVAGVCWLLVGPNPFYLMQVDSGSNEVIVDSSDMTGFASACFAMTNTFGVTAPLNVRLHSVTPGGCLSQGVNLAAGSNFKMEGGDIQGCIGTACQGIFAANTFSGGIIVSGVQFDNGGAYSLYIGTVSNVTAHGNIFGMGATNAVNVISGADYIAGIGNTCVGASAGLTGTIGTHSYFPSGTGGNPGC
jgi:hypothetical protein